MHLTVYSNHVKYAYHSECTLSNCQKVKKLFPQNRHKILRLSCCRGTRTHNHIVRKGTLNHLAQLAKWFCCLVGTYLYFAFGCMFLSCHVHISEWLHTLYFPDSKKHFVQNRRKISILINCNGTQTNNDLVSKQTLNHLVKLAKIFTYIASTFMYGRFDCTYHVPYEFQS